MNTPAHIIFGTATFGNPDRRAVTAAAIAGALIPDLSLYVLSGWELRIKGTSANDGFGRYITPKAGNPSFGWTTHLSSGGFCLLSG